VDAAPPPSPPAIVAPPTFAYGATDFAPITAEEKDLCDTASRTDWLYLSGLVALDVASIYLDAVGLNNKGNGEPGIRMLGPAAVGLTWGATVSGMVLALPKCSPTWVAYAPPEGDVRNPWPLAFGLALLAGATAPVTVGIETGPPGGNWTVEERAGRIIVAGVAGFAGAFIPYLLPPKTWRAAKKLENIRAGADGREAFVGYSLRF